jgi:putative transposase
MLTGWSVVQGRPVRSARADMPADVIAQAFWRSCRVLPSLRMVEDLLAACGIIDCHKTVRRCAETFGRDSTNQIRRRAPQLHDTWHPETVSSPNGRSPWRWRAVDREGFVLDVLVESRRDTRALRVWRKLIREQVRVPRVLVTNTLASCGAARSDHRPSVEHPQHKGLNKRDGTSHRPVRRRERIMQRSTSAPSRVLGVPSTTRSPTCFALPAAAWMLPTIDLFEPKRWAWGPISPLFQPEPERHEAAVRSIVLRNTLTVLILQCCGADRAKLVEIRECSDRFRIRASSPFSRARRLKAQERQCARAPSGNPRGTCPVAARERKHSTLSRQS